MIEARFDTEALTRVRFAISPMWEVTRSAKALRDPAAAALHLPWVERALPRVADLDLAPLFALQNAPDYNPDFVNPPPSTPLVEFEDELQTMLATPDEQISAEVRYGYEGVPLPAVLEPFLSEPRSAIDALADLMREYWLRCHAENWPRMRSLLEHDVLYRSRQIADGGTARLFCDLADGVGWSDGVLRIPGSCDGSLDVDDRGLLLMPSVFVWPKVTALTLEPWQPTVVYPARGVGMLWSPEDAPSPPQALERLVGRTRATLLNALDSPRTTTELAGELGLSPGGVSQHLTVLRDAGLVHGRRVARSVLYLRSAQGSALVKASGADETSGEVAAA
jgi:DNA-binding transcriptional ArsR family regulator